MRTSAKTIEAPRESHHHAPDSVTETNSKLRFAEYESQLLSKANHLIEQHRKGGLTKEQRRAMKAELPTLLEDLRELRATRLELSDKEAQKPGKWWMYERGASDDAIRLMLARIRNINTDLNRMWGTRTFRKVYNAFGEDRANWGEVKKRQFFDGLRQGLLTAKAVGKFGLVAGGLTAGGLLASYSYSAGGLVPGAQKLMTDAGPFASTVGGHLQKIGGTLSTTFTSLKDSILGTAAAKAAQ